MLSILSLTVYIFDGIYIYILIDLRPFVKKNFFSAGNTNICMRAHAHTAMKQPPAARERRGRLAAARQKINV